MKHKTAAVRSRSPKQVVFMTLHQPFRQISRSINVWRHRDKDLLCSLCLTRCSPFLWPIGRPLYLRATPVLWASIRILGLALSSQPGLIEVPIAEQECLVMNRIIASCLLLIFASLFAVQSWAQDAAPVVEAMGTPTEITSLHVALVPQRLFSAIPISTHSDEARKFIELAIDKYENDLLDDAVVHAKHATESDPQSALAYGFLSFAARRGTPNAAALARAKGLLPRATPDEQLLVRWMTSIQDGDLLPAIMTMNDLIKRYPKDKHVLYLTSEWLYFQQDNDRAQQMMETTLQIDPNFPPALNILGHAYLETGNPDPAKAIAALKRYVELEPGQPNPEYSLGEVLRYIGEDQGSEIPTETVSQTTLFRTSSSDVSIAD